MRKILYACLCIAVLGYSCKKENKGGGNITPDNKTYQLTFSIKGNSKSLVQAQRNLSLTANSSSTDVLNSLDYAVYDNNGVLVHHVSTASTDAGFGTVTENLKAGTYYFVFVGNGVIGGVPTGGPSTYATAQFGLRTLHNPAADIFYKNDTVTVSSSNINESLTLDRLTSQLQIKSTTVVPNKIDSIQAVITDLGSFYCTTGLPVSGSTYTRTLSHHFTAAEKGISNFQMSSYVYNTTGTLGVKLTQYYQGKANTPIVINNVICHPNTITILSGNMFQPDPNSVASFQVSFDPDWNIQHLTF